MLAMMSPKAFEFTNGGSTIEVKVNGKEIKFPNVGECRAHIASLWTFDVSTELRAGIVLGVTPRSQVQVESKHSPT